jgi:hypothetical protein
LEREIDEGDHPLLKNRGDVGGDHSGWRRGGLVVEMAMWSASGRVRTIDGS